MASYPEPMDAENYREVSWDLRPSSSRCQSTSCSTRTSAGLSASMGSPISSSWCFSDEEIPLVERFVGSDIEELNSKGYIKSEKGEGILRITCLATGRHFETFNHSMEEVKDRVSLLKKNKSRVSINGDLPSCSQEKIQNYIEDRNRTIKDGWLCLCSGYVVIYGLTYDAREREESKVKKFLEKSETDLKVQFSSQRSASLGIGTRHKNLAGSKHQAASLKHGVCRTPLFATKEGIEVYVYNHSITTLHTDAIVNAANEDLMHIGGVAKAIADSAGAGVEYTCISYKIKNGPLHVTENVHTEAGKLNNKYIIHAVGPRWSRYQNKEQCLNDLCRTVAYALDTASNLRCVDVGMPAISAGIFGVPKVLCAVMYIAGIEKYSKQIPNSTVKQVHIVDVDDEILREIKYVCKEYKKNPKLLEPKESLCHFNFNNPLTGSRNLQSSRGPGYRNDVSTTGYSMGRNGDLGNQLWVHNAPSRIPGLDDSVENFTTDNGLFTVKIYTGSIVRVRDVDAILCSADRDLSGLGPLGMALRTAGGTQYEKHFETMRRQASSSTDTVFKCQAGYLPVRYVVHVVIDSMATVKRHSLKTYKQQVCCGFKKVNAWILKAIAMPLVGAGFVEKNQYDLERVCEAMQLTLTDFCREETSRHLSEVHLVNKNPTVTKTLFKHFMRNSVPPASVLHYPSNASNEASGRLKQRENGARPRSATLGVESLAISDQEEQHGKHGSKHLCYSTKRRSTSPKKFNVTVHTTSPKSDISDIEGLMAGEEAKTISTRLKQTCGNIIILDKTEDRSSSHQNRATNSHLKQTTEVSSSRHPKVAVNNLLKQSDNQKRYDGGVCSHCDKSSAEMTRLQCGHSFCNTPCFLPMVNNRICPVCKAVDYSVAEDAPKTDDMCVICMDAVTDPKQLPCDHFFCNDCIMQSMAHKPACPVCGKIFGMLKGDQPEDGTMHVKTRDHPSLSGYESVGTIEIRYVFPNGTQKENHPHPGKPYQGTERRAFLPDNKEGRKVLRLLQKAFESRLTFTIGSSRTTGKEDVVTWNDIHHKTKRDGGAAKFGYPDPTYLTRVQEELAAKGIKE